ncbi:hypothetical protein ASPTUDRAFT_52116 [Aspergillus tubingensis CBS 134.48]|uniref:Uncharacterized protein n=1 Tax=Aspergillus tubingensis (strain CBS 134.48) TaxID=767770 RepID=A0A1L9NLX2_ASPTC|nr:hypothetical protein ASPTUDRAFT_52116 [Aspergillus tubingensis CBS 134.48]
MSLEVGTRSLLASDSLTPSRSGSYAAAEIPATIYHWTELRRRSSPDFLEWEVSRTGGLLHKGSEKGISPVEPPPDLHACASRVALNYPNPTLHDPPRTASTQPGPEHQPKSGSAWGQWVRQDDAKLRSQHAPSSGLNQSGVHSPGMGRDWVDGGTRGNNGRAHRCARLESKKEAWIASWGK